MTLSASLLRQLENPNLSINQRAQLRCHAARELENSGRYEDAEAERVARAAVCVLEKGDQQAILAEALISHGTALARLGYYGQARSTFQRAVGVAQLAGATNRAQEAALTFVHEPGDKLVASDGPPVTFTDTLSEKVRRFEHDMIKDALIRAKGHITQAARLLDISYQHLDYIIEHRHRDLIDFMTRKKERPRRK